MLKRSSAVLEIGFWPDKCYFFNMTVDIFSDMIPPMAFSAQYAISCMHAQATHTHTLFNAGFPYDVNGNYFKNELSPLLLAKFISSNEHY